MSDSKVANINQGELLTILLTAYQKGEKSVINTPKEMVQDLILQMKSVETK